MKQTHLLYVTDCILLAGPSLVFLDEREKKALDAYVLYYRPLAALCKKTQCFVYPTRKPYTSERCCHQMTVSNLGKAIKRMGRTCKVPRKVTSRILRRSQISGFFSVHSAPAKRQQLATQAGHSVDTAERYYDVSDKVKSGLIVVDDMSQMRVKDLEERQRQEAATAEADAPLAPVEVAEQPPETTELGESARVLQPQTAAE